MTEQKEVILSVKILAGKGIKGLKGEHVNTFIRVQFSDFDFSDSQIVLDSSSPEFNFSYSIPMQVNEEKTAVLGTCETKIQNFLNYPKVETQQSTVSLPPELFLQKKIPVNYLNQKLLALPNLPANAKNNATAAQVVNEEDLIPEIEVQISLSSLLLDPEVVDNGNFIHLKVDDVYPVPEEWSLREGTEKDLNTNVFTYNINFMLPAQTTPERLITIPMGLLLQNDIAVPTDPALTAPVPIYLSKPQTASNGQLLSTAPVAIEEQPSSIDGKEQMSPSSEKTEAVKPTEILHTSSGTFKKVSWNFSYIIWVPPDAVIKLKEKLIQKLPLEVEFVRELQPKFSQAIDVNVNKYRGRTLIDFYSLLYPRCIGVKGRFPLEVYDVRPQSSENNTSVPTQAAPVSVETTSKKLTKVLKDEGNLYKTLGTTIGLEIILDKFLLTKKKLLPVEMSVRDYIPKRVIPQHMLYEKRSKQADEEYHLKIQEIVKKLVIEYQGVLKTVLNSGSASQNGVTGIGSGMFSNIDSTEETIDNLLPLPFVPSKSLREEQQRKKNFLFHLNKSGAYFYFKEQLKSAVVEVVRERFRKTSPFTSKSELQLFMSQIYVYLTDQLHISVNKMFQDANKIAKDPTVSRTVDHSSLKRLAEDAESNGDTCIATGYHKERVAKYPESTQAWFDYGLFCRRNGMNATARECFKEILSVNPQHTGSLLAYGAICAENEQFEKARVFFHSVVDLQPNYVLPHTILGLFYDIIGEEEESEKYFELAKKLHESNNPPNSNDTNQKDEPSIYLAAANFLISCLSGQLTERALTEEMLSTGPKISAYLLLGKLEHLRGNYEQSLIHMQDALKMKQDDPNIWSSLGNTYYLQKNWDKAQSAYETVMTLTQNSKNMEIVYVRLGTIYLHLIKNKDHKSELSKQEIYLAKQAKTMFLNACQSTPDSYSAWLGAGRACIFLNELSEAEDALSEANVLNNRDGQIWGYLSYLCLLMQRDYEASQSIAQAFRLGIKDKEVLR
ncbi:Cilia- and flagella-associated protein 70 [Clydaea vesicula]|uniref:Cilia- and flagella-associated protein 70 n=1 Tax=Clydaea vesicula TaxID=447962 RepID=A0AAD5XUY8_9FUNG|nr:Cilia- and flagella-associated protein 70 [Clydaea vesicula]